MITEVFDADLFVTYQDYYYNDWGERKDISPHIYEVVMHIGGERIDITNRLTAPEKQILTENLKL